MFRILPSPVWLPVCAALVGFLPSALATPPVQLVGSPALSPTGNRVAFAWNGDIWSVPTEGGIVRQLTAHPASDSQPIYSRDGEQLAFVSNRSGSAQVYVMPAEGGTPRQVTWHSEGYRVHDWWPDGKSLLVTSTRDHHWRDAERMYRVWVDGSRPEELIVDAAASDPALSSDGTRILLVREGERWWRKGYHGARAAQIWLYDLEMRTFTQVVREEFDCRWPAWHPDDSGFTYTRGEIAGYDLWQARWSEGEEPKLEQERVVDADTFSVVFPAVASGTGEVVYRHGKDLYRWKQGERPRRLQLELASDAALVQDEFTRELDRASDLAFSSDGLEIAFIAGGDVWVMDTLLREPRQVTTTPGYESSVVWGPDDESLWVVQQQSTRTELFRIERKDPEELWWRASDFRVEQVTDDADSESRLRFTPDGKHAVYVRNRGELWVRHRESGRMWQIAGGFDPPQFDISPDSRWVAYSQTDDNFNRDVFIAALDGSRPPVNVSQHPDDDEWPTFSRDGKLLAYTGLQVEGEPDIYYVYLERAEDEKSSRERKLEEAIVKLVEAREKNGSSGSDDDSEEEAKDSEEKKEGEKEPKDKKKSDDPELVKIDFDRIHERVRRVAIGGARERSLVWIDDQKLLFQAEINGKRGIWSLEFPDKLEPKFFGASDLRDAVWSPKAKALFVNDEGTPARVNTKGEVERYPFRVRQTVSRSARYAHAFDVAWRTMRDRWYDPRLGNKHWEEVRRRYHGMAEQATDERQFGEVVELMLGELNGSHLGFRPGRESSGWQGPEFAPVTAHLGLRFAPGNDGEGLEIRDVLPGGPADRAELAIAPGDRLMAIDGNPLRPETDLTRLLTGRLDRDLLLAIKPRRNGAEEPREVREVVVRPITYDRARGLLYDAWLERNRCRVGELSQGKLGYLHIRQMNMGSFSEFERQLYAAGNGKEGLVIDVRDNGGGSTADLLLTSLTQPRHATTVPRGGGPGYPQSRMVFATWQKPIVVLCNQNSYSNAEIFSHAIKTLGRGKLVGVPTAGGVISTGETRVIDVGTMRMPFRGWFVLGSGTDMELAGAVPDVIVWPEPGEIPQGIDRQLDRGVEVLAKEVANQPATPKLEYATEREQGG